MKAITKKKKKEQIIANQAEEIPMTSVRIEPGPPGQ